MTFRNTSAFLSAAASFALLASAAHTATADTETSENFSRTIEVEMRDNYFEPEAITVARGESIRFVIRNEGQFVHEFNIGTAAKHVQHQAEMQMMVDHGVLEADRINRDMMSMDMGNGHTMSHDHANSVLLEPGESGEIIWTFESDQNLEFACNVPGHYDAGMVGVIDVDAAGVAGELSDDTLNAN